jgi:hypothetical protein
VKKTVPTLDMRGRFRFCVPAALAEGQFADERRAALYLARKLRRRAAIARATQPLTPTNEE